MDLPVLAAVSAGGVLGALARYGLTAVAPGGIWVTWFINVSGCLLIGALYERTQGQRWVRPLLGTGVLGGYTTFSAAMVDTIRAEPVVAVAYCVATLAGALLAVWAGSALARTR
ncbi:CrcB family protein [Actinoplanes sp. NPDC051633]|uniref:fluoride efflux transporter FluC n=1 Tax=Actinoplanes sp. NPDC051633 TaxID=3155670 RepID=UPI0034469322